MKKRMRIEKADQVIVFKAIMFYLSICLLAVGVLYLAFHELAKQWILAEKNNAQKELETQVREAYVSIDAELQRANAICYSLLQNENFRYILNSTDEGQCLNAIHRLGKQININKISDDAIEDILVHFCVDDGINVDADGKVDTQARLESFFPSEEDLSYVRDEKEEFTGGSLIYLKNGQVCFRQSYPVTAREEGLKSIFFIKLKNEILNNALSGYDLDAGVEILTTVLDVNTGKAALNSEWTEIPGMSERTWKQEEGFEQIGGYLVAYRTSGRIPIVYISMKSVKELNAAVRRIGIISKAFFILCVILCIGLLGAGIWRSYNPIRQLLSLVNGEENGKIHVTNFYSEIRGILLETLEQKMAYENLYEEKNSLEKRRKFYTVLSDRKSSDEAVLKRAHAIKLYPERGVNCFICLKFIDITSCFSKAQEEGDEEQPVHFCEAFLLKILTKNYKAISIPFEERILFCLSWEENTVDNSGQALKYSLEQAQNLLRERYAIDTLVAVSNYHAGAGGLKIGLSEVRRTMEHLEFTGNKSFGEYYALSLFDYGNHFYRHPLKEENFLENDIRAGEIAKAREVFGQIMEKYYYSQDLAPQVYRLRLYSLLGKILDSVDYCTGNKSLEEISEFSSLIEFDNVDEFCRKMNLLFDNIEKESQSGQTDLEGDFVKTVQEMIADNYMNADLNVTAIADSLHKSLDFVSRTFKKNTGEGLLDYIQRVRIDKAKQFFRENKELSVLQVANMVGYVSCESFIRVFKSKEGTTPGRYKSSLK